MKTLNEVLTRIQQSTRWSPATQESYGISWTDFHRFCDERDEAPLPAKPETVAAFLYARALTLATSTLSGRMAAIEAVHVLNRTPLRARETCIRDAWADIRRSKGSAKKAKRALTADDLKRILDGLPATEIQTRAIFLLSFSGLTRRSECVAFDREDITIFDEGMTVRIRHSKTDKAGNGEDVTIGRRKDDYCPVAALERWLTHAEIESGPIFRSAPGRRMHKRLVATLTKKWGANAGYDPHELGAHSWRSGGITTMNMAGVDTKAGMTLSRHKTPSIYLGYVQPKKGLDNPAVKALQIA